MDPYVQAKKAIYNEIVCLEQNDCGLNIRQALELSGLIAENNCNWNIIENMVLNTPKQENIGFFKFIFGPIEIKKISVLTMS